MPIRRLSVFAVLAVLTVVLSLVAFAMTHDSAPPWRPAFPGRGLVSNEVAYRHPHLKGVHTSSDWRVTSGSLFADDGSGYTGTVDGGDPDVDSAHANGSAVLRAVSVRTDFQDVRVSLQLDVAGLTTTARTGKNDWDGVHLFLRYTDENQLYTVDLCRRDGTVAVKKKAPQSEGGPDGYTTLAQASMDCPMRHWASFVAEAANTAQGVRLTLSTPAGPVVTALDKGAGGAPPLRAAGRVGIRGDNATFHFRYLAVKSLH